MATSRRPSFSAACALPKSSFANAMESAANCAVGFEALPVEGGRGGSVPPEGPCASAVDVETIDAASPTNNGT